MALQAPAVAPLPFQKGIDVLERNLRNTTVFMLNWLSLATGCVSQLIYLIYWDVLDFFIIFPEKFGSYWFLKFQLYIEWLYHQPHYS